MDIHLESLPEDLKFEVKLQIELYHLSEKVQKDERAEDFEKYRAERKEKLKNMLNVDSAKIYEGGNLIFTL
jgi:hypothetical protein